MKLAYILYYYLIPELITIIITIIWSIIKKEIIITVYSSILIAFWVGLLMYLFWGDDWVQTPKCNDCSCNDCSWINFNSMNGTEVFALILGIFIVAFIFIYLFFLLLKLLGLKGRIFTFHLLFLLYILLVTIKIFYKYFDDKNYIIYGILIIHIINFILLIIIAL